jgi:hypothetical protein
MSLCGFGHRNNIMKRERVSDVVSKPSAVRGKPDTSTEAPTLKKVLMVSH